MSNLNGLFRQFVSTIANSAGGFVNAFDDSKDGIVLKAEFQANMSQNKADWVNNWNGETANYNDLIDSFWSSFDNIYKKGEIYDTNIQNAYALDRTESGKVQKQMDVFFKVNQLFDEALKGKLTFLSKYPEISNYIKGEVANNIIDNNIDDAENLNLNDLLNRINNVINSNADSIKNILLQDLLKNGSLNFNYTAVDGYNPLNDANLMTRINSSITGFSGGIEGLKEYLNSGLNNEIEKISEIANAYLSDDAKLDVDNNYQIARLAAIYLKTAESMIPADLDEQQREKALARAKESAMNGAKELLGKQGYEDYTIAGACSNATSFHTGLYSCKFLATSAFSKFKDYISALSLSVTVDGGLYYTLIEALKENDYSEAEAQAIVQCLVDNGKDIPEYVALVESIAEQVYTSTEQPVDYYALITDAIVNGNMGTSTTSWLSWLEKEAGITKATGSTSGENNPGGDGGDVKEKIEVAKLKDIAPIGTEYSFNYYDASGNSYPLNTQNFNDLYKDDVYVNIYGRHEKNWDGVDVLTPAKENLKKLADLIKKSLLATGKFDEAKLDQAVQNMIEFYISNLHKYKWGDSDVEMGNTPSAFAIQMAEYNYSGLCYIFNEPNASRDRWEAAYFMVGFKEFTDAIVNEYNDINLGNTDLYSLDSVKFNNTDETIAGILLDDKANGLLLANWNTLPSAKSTAKIVIENTLNQLGDQLKDAGLNEAKVDYAITTTINLYKAAIDCINDIREDKGGTDKDYNVKYKDKNGKDMSYNYNYTQYTGEYGSDCDIINGSGMIGLSNSGNLGLRMEEAFNYGGGDNTSYDNRYTIAVNMRCLLETVNSFL